MKTDLSSEQIASYQENGFLVIHDFLTQEELSVWRKAVDAAVARREDRRLAKSDERSGDSYYDNVFIQRVNLWQDNEEMRPLMLDARLGKLAAELAGVAGIRIWHDQALIKKPYGNPTAWHLDNPYWSFSSRDAISIWIALDDATLENGCLWFVPGSHKLTSVTKNAGIGMNMADLFKAYPELTKVDPVPVPAKAGDALFHNGLTAHGANANMTRGWRRAMTCAFMPDGATFNGIRNIL